MSEAVEPDPYDQLRAFLREQVALAPSRKPTGYEAVKAVLPEIKALKAKHRTDAEIREFLSRMGVTLSLATLRQYTQSATRELAGHKPPVRKRGKAISKPGSKPATGTGTRPASKGSVPPGASRPSGSAITGHTLDDSDL